MSRSSPAAAPGPSDAKAASTPVVSQVSDLHGVAGPSVIPIDVVIRADLNRATERSVITMLEHVRNRE